MKFILHLIRDYFGFSRIESRGLLFLLAVITLSLTLSIYYQQTGRQSYELLLQDRQALDVLISRLDKLKTEEEENAKEVVNTSGSRKLRRFLFDPNTAPVNSLMELGIPEFLSHRIDKYRSKGGKFRKPEDLLKIYGFEKPLYQELEAYIRIVDSKPYPKGGQLHRHETTPANTAEIAIAEAAEPEMRRININETDSLALQMLRGIGQVTSSRIIKFRDRLGGIHSLEQLKEVYHINEDAIKSLEEHAFVEENFEIRKININQVDFKTLLSHPYVDYEVAKAIMNHRRIYGNFTSTDQLKEVYQIKEELLVKLLPYLVI